MKIFSVLSLMVLLAASAAQANQIDLTCQGTKSDGSSLTVAISAKGPHFNRYKLVGGMEVIDSQGKITTTSLSGPDFPTNSEMLFLNDKSGGSINVTLVTTLEQAVPAGSQNAPVVGASAQISKLAGFNSSDFGGAIPCAGVASPNAHSFFGAVSNDLADILDGLGGGGHP